METASTSIATISNLPALLRTIEGAVSPATIPSYETALRTLNNRFALNGWTLCPMNEDGELNGQAYITQILSYLQQRMDDGVSKSTLNTTLSAVKWHAKKNHLLAVGHLESPLITEFMKGTARNLRGQQVKKASALKIENLTTLHRHYANTHSVRAV